MPRQFIIRLMKRQLYLEVGNNTIKGLCFGIYLWANKCEMMNGAANNKKNLCKTEEITTHVILQVTHSIRICLEPRKALSRLLCVKSCGMCRFRVLAATWTAIFMSCLHLLLARHKCVKSDPRHKFLLRNFRSNRVEFRWQCVGSARYDATNGIPEPSVSPNRKCVKALINCDWQRADLNGWLIRHALFPLARMLIFKWQWIFKAIKCLSKSAQPHGVQTHVKRAQAVNDNNVINNFNLQKVFE